MKKFYALLLAVMVVALSFSSCSKDKDEAPETVNENVPSGEGIYLGIIGFNTNQYVKDISKLTSSTRSSFIDFVSSLNMGRGTGLYYADYNALKKLNDYTQPPKLKNVALVTFTDGLDNVSLDGERNPDNYNSQAEYMESLHNRIVNEKINGLSISAYTIGLKGEDVGDEIKFDETLKKLASNDDNAFRASNMDEVTQRFSEIASSLYSVSTTVNLGVDLPGGYEEGQVLRFTFDDVSSATSSSKYIQATYHRTSSSSLTLDNITYQGFIQGATTISSSSKNADSYYHFQFDDLKYTNEEPVSQSDINRIKLWKQNSTGDWDKETEFDPASSSNITEDKSSALILLVLDCTSSLGDDFPRMKQAAQNFINTLANSNVGNNPGGGNNSDGGSSNAGTNDILGTWYVDYCAIDGDDYTDSEGYRNKTWTFYNNGNVSGYFGWNFDCNYSYQNGILTLSGGDFYESEYGYMEETILRFTNVQINGSMLTLSGDVTYRIVEYGETESETYSIYIRLSRNTSLPLPTEGSFEWVRQGGGAATGLDEFGLYWNRNNNKAYFAYIQPLDGSRLYILSASDYDATSLYSIYFPTESDLYKNVSVDANGTYNDVIATVYNGKTYLINVTRCSVVSYSYGTKFTITGSYKRFDYTI
jgi:hypothetical protein